MTLAEFFAALQKDMLIDIKEVQTVGEAQQEVSLVRVYSAGYQNLLASLLSRTVDKVTVNDAARCDIVLAAAL